MQCSILEVGDIGGLGGAKGRRWGSLVSAMTWPPASPLPGREGLGVGPAEALGGLRQNVLGGPLGVGVHVAVPQPNDTPTKRLKRRRSLRVVTGLIMVLRAINLDREFRLSTCKIDDVPIDHQLPGKRRPVTRQQTPQHALRIGRLAAQRSCAIDHYFRNAAHGDSVERRALLANPPPTPPFQGGEKQAARVSPRPGRRALNPSRWS